MGSDRSDRALHRRMSVRDDLREAARWELPITGRRVYRMSFAGSITREGAVAAYRRLRRAPDRDATQLGRDAEAAPAARLHVPLEAATEVVSLTATSRADDAAFGAGIQFLRTSAWCRRVADGTWTRATGWPTDELPERSRAGRGALPFRDSDELRGRVRRLRGGDVAAASSRSEQRPTVADARMVTMGLSDGSGCPKRSAANTSSIAPLADGLFHRKSSCRSDGGRTVLRQLGNVTGAGLGGNVEVAVEIECGVEPSPSARVAARPGVT